MQDCSYCLLTVSIIHLSHVYVKKDLNFKDKKNVIFESFLVLHIFCYEIPKEGIVIF